MPFDIATLSAAYRDGLTPMEMVDAAYQRIDAAADNPIWITLVPKEQAMARARELHAGAREFHAGASAAQLPLYGIPFAVKDNIDVASLPTTAACPAFSYRPERNATAVERLLAAGAICLGKTNLDQFATGLVGSRSPFGAVRNALHSAYLSGGSSSGSAVAVALGQVSFSLGTDTAGSGRVPASFNNIVGLKPTRGLVSTAGVVPACRSLDCVSVFAGTCADAARVLGVIEGPDAADAYSRSVGKHGGATPPVIGVPHAEQLQWFGDRESPALFMQAAERLERLGARIVAVDFAPFIQAGQLLYGGPWVAERHAAIRDFMRTHAGELLPVTREIIGGAEKYSATDVFLAQYQLAALMAATAPLWKDIDALCIPTAATLYTLDEERSEPVKLNANLGYYTNFVNLLDLSALALPSALRANRLPFGICLVAPAGADDWLCRLGAQFHAASGLPIGATTWMPPTSREPGAPLPAATLPAATPPSATPHAVRPHAVNPPAAGPLAGGNHGSVQLAVVGAHLSGEPLNYQLTERGARLLRSTRTAPRYRLYALPGSTPAKPGLVRSDGDGAALEVEIWELQEREFGSFVAAIPAPLGVGTLELADGSSVKGFLCESYVTRNATDISSYGGWRAYLNRSPFNRSPA